MLIKDKIASLASNAGLTVKELAERIGMSEQGFHAMFRNKSMKVSTLIAISEIVKCNPAELVSTGETKYSPPESLSLVNEHSGKTAVEMFALYITNLENRITAIEDEKKGNAPKVTYTKKTEENKSYQKK